MRRYSRRYQSSKRLWLATLVAALVLFNASCAERTQREPALLHASSEASVYVASLGNLRTGRPPTKAQTDLAVFLFGVEPDQPLGLIKPMDVVSTGDELWVCDGVFQSVLRWTPENSALDGVSLDALPPAPVAITRAAVGEHIVAGERIGVRYSAQGTIIARYTLPSDRPGRVGGVAFVGDEVWMTNVPAHRIEVFGAASGEHRRSIGGRGRGPGEFGFPLDMAVGPEGNVYVVDMLNARVQVLKPDGTWIREIGGPGDRIGRFGRPKSVTVGPDGTVFVVDATSQCVHAFDDRGRPLLTFGGAADGADALALPAGVAIWEKPITASRELPADFRPAYYVVVAEQLVRPGLRVYAWSGARDTAVAVASVRQSDAPRFVSSVESPHWRADRCTACHVADQGPPRAIESARVDQLCLSCHDGKKAMDEAHPIGRVAATAGTRVPAGWPLVEGRLGCLTCHDIRKHCDDPASRSSENPALIRDFDATNRLATCTQCHVSEQWRVNPHRRDVAGMSSPTASCGFCHTSTPMPAGDGWTFDAKLREDATKLCLNCHTMHADPAPHGHLGAVVADAMKQVMAQSERERGLDPASCELLPLNNGHVACSTCHNPHAADAQPAELFRSPTAQIRSTAPPDVGKALRIEQMALCRYCHGK